MSDIHQKLSLAYSRTGKQITIYLSCIHLMSMFLRFMTVFMMMTSASSVHMNGNVPEIVNYLSGKCLLYMTDFASTARWALECSRQSPFTCLQLDKTLSYPDTNRRMLNWLCGFMWERGSQPKQEYWSINTHARLIMNMTFTHFNIPIFRPNCPSLYLAVTGLVHDSDTVAVYCGRKEPWTIYLLSEASCVFQTDYHLTIKQGFIAVYSSARKSLLYNKNQTVHQITYINYGNQKGTFDYEYFPSLQRAEFVFYILVDPMGRACVHFADIVYSLHQQYGMLIYDGPGKKSRMLILSNIDTANTTCFTAFRGTIVTAHDGYHTILAVTSAPYTYQKVTMGSESDQENARQSWKEFTFTIDTHARCLYVKENRVLLELTITDMQYFGADSQYESLGRSCNYGGLFMYRGRHAYFLEHMREPLAHYCSDMKTAVFDVQQLWILLIPYPPYSRFTVSFIITINKKDVNDPFYAECSTSDIIPVTIDYGKQIRPSEPLRMSLFHRQSTNDNTGRFGCYVSLASANLGGLGPLRIKVHSYSDIDKTFYKLNVENKSLLTIQSMSYVDFPANMKKVKFAFTIEEGEVSLTLNDTHSIQVVEADPILSASLYVTLHIQAYPICNLNYELFRENRLGREHESYLYSTSGYWSPIMVDQACKFELRSKTTDIYVRFTAAVAKKYIRMSIYNENYNNITSVCYKFTLQQIVIREADTQNGSLLTHTWKNVARLEWMFTSQDCRFTLVQDRDNTCFTMTSSLLTENAVYIPILTSGNDKAMKMKDDLLFFPAR